MSVRNAGKSIREARKKAGLTQEKLSDGICSLLSLSRIENGTAGVSPSTFRALMARAGAPCGIYPEFENWDDFECFFHLKHARFHLDAWQLVPAEKELNDIEHMKWNHNKFYYQEWLLLCCRLQFRSGRSDHEKSLETLLPALRMTQERLNLFDFSGLPLSLVEIELLISIAHENLYLGNLNLCGSLCTQLISHLTDIQITFMEKEHLLSELAVVHVKYLIACGDYAEAQKIAREKCHQILLNGDCTSLFELSFLTGLSAYYGGDENLALSHFKDVFYSSHAASSPYATISRSYVCKHLTLKLPDSLLAVSDIPLMSFPVKKYVKIRGLREGVYDYENQNTITIGRMIQELRSRQKISQQTLCAGLCSTSKLSKIENGILRPDVVLAEALLNRLGLSEREFVFWGDNEEAEFFELKFQLLRTNHVAVEWLNAYMTRLEKFTEDKGILYRQFYLFRKALCLDSSENRIRIFWAALDLTQKDFDIFEIIKYRLSWCELSILNNIAIEYRNQKLFQKSTVFYRQILEYYRTAQMDVILQVQTLTVTLADFCRLLYLEGYYREALDYFEHTNYNVLNYSLTFLGLFYFYYGQVLGECSCNEKVPLAVRYACGLENLKGHQINSEGLIDSIYTDFSIKIDY